MTFKPMLAGKAADIRFPVLASPKLDGVRATILNGQLVSRSLKPFANKYTQQRFSHHLLEGLDGEFILGDPCAPDVFLRTSEALRRIDGSPQLTFWVFDHHEFALRAFKYRMRKARDFADNARDLLRLDVRFLGHTQIDDKFDLDVYESRAVDKGYEGVMLRDPDGLYKFGRSTTKEGGLLKLKRYEDDEAVIIGIEEEMHNGNTAKRSELGNMKRSSHKENKVGKGTMGALIVRGLTGRFKDVEFNIGTGFTAAQRAQAWPVGTIVTFKYFPVGVKDKPRHPVFHRIKADAGV